MEKTDNKCKKKVKADDMGMGGKQNNVQGLE